MNLKYPDGETSREEGDFDFQVVLNFDGLNLVEPGDYEFRYKINEALPQALRLRARLKARNPQQ